MGTAGGVVPSTTQFPPKRSHPSGPRHAADYTVATSQCGVEPPHLAVGRHRHCGVWAVPQQFGGDSSACRGAIAHQAGTPYLNQQQESPAGFGRVGGGDRAYRLQPSGNSTKTEPLPV